MRALVPIIRLAWRAHPGAFVSGLLLLALTLVAGLALLGLAGWFITAGALAGAAGVGLLFDVFRPSAAIRFLAIVRTLARYGERLVSHEATLRFLAGLRIRLFHGFAVQPYARLMAMRGAIALNRLTGDVDALDAIYLRVLAPLGVCLVSLAAAFVALLWLVDVWVASWVLACVSVVALTALALGVRAASRPVRRHAFALDALRLRLIDLARGGADLAAAGRLAQQAATTTEAGRRASDALMIIDRLERTAAVLVPVASMLAAAGALVIGSSRDVPPARLAIAVFVALALNEAVQPLRRVILDLVRARLAAARVGPWLGPVGRSPRDACTAGSHGAGVVVSEFAASDIAASDIALRDPTGIQARAPEPVAADTPTLCLEQLVYRHAPDRPAVLDRVSLRVGQGEWVALTGASGAGKSTLLLLAAGLLEPQEGTVTVTPGHSFAYLPQRSQLFAGTVAENLRLACPQAEDERMREVLRIVELEAVVDARGGLGFLLGDGGSGLSGGESRRLALARVLLRDADLLLLDEPTTGLDADTATRVLTNLRVALAGRAVLTASHQPVEIGVADRRVGIG